MTSARPNRSHIFNDQTDWNTQVKFQPRLASACSAPTYFPAVWRLQLFSWLMLTYLHVHAHSFQQTHRYVNDYCYSCTVFFWLREKIFLKKSVTRMITRMSNLGKGGWTIFKFQHPNCRFSGICHLTPMRGTSFICTNTDAGVCCYY